MTEQEIIEAWTSEAKIRYEQQVKHIISELNQNNKPYGHFTQTYDDMIKVIAEIHGEDDANNVKKLIEG